MARTNLYAGPCSVCGTEVKANDGTAEPPGPGAKSNRWITKCNACAGVVKDAKPKILVKQEGANVTFKPDGFLGGDLFSAYRKATDGAKFNGACNSAPIAKAITILKALHDAGFVVDMEPSLAGNLQAKTAEIKDGVVAAVGRANKVDEALRARGLALFPFQKTGVQWLASRSGALLADDMGLGKTIQALIAIPEGVPVLVVGPAVAKGVWQDEAAKWRPDLKVTVLSGRGSFRWPAPGELIVTNYDILSDNLGGAPAEGTVVIGDESHVLKSFKTAKTSRFRAISEAVRALAGRVWLLSATPLLNRPGELWSILQAAGIANECFGSWRNYTSLYNAYEGTYGGWVWGDPTPEVSERLKKVMLRRMKVDVLPELPPKTWRDLVVDLDEKTKKACSKAASLLETYTRFSRINDDEKPSDLVARETDEAKADFKAKYGEDLNKILEDAETLLQRISGLDFDEIAKARTALAIAKIPALLALVEDYEEQEEPLIVFSAHRAPIDIFANRPGWAVITGDTSSEDRRQIQDDFQAGKLKGIAGTIKAAGVALTLTRASHAIFVDLEWTPALNSQAEDRLLRIGQTRGVLITTLVANFPLDKRVHELLTFKRNLIKYTVDAATTIDPTIVIPEIASDDLDAIAKMAQEEAQKAKDAKNAADRRAEDFKGRKEEIEAENEKKRSEQKRQDKRERILNAARRDPAIRRGPQNVREEWVRASLTTLAALDPDRAREKNDVGFSAGDGPKGHKFAIISLALGLTDAEWSAAITLCKKYWRQVGQCPE